MLKADSEGLLKLSNNVKRSICILNVVVRHLLAVKLLSCSQRVGNTLRRGVELCLLVRVLAIAQRLHKVERSKQLLVQLRLLAHIGSDAHIILCGMCIGLCRELKACLTLGVATLLNLGDDTLIVLRVANNSYIAVVLGCRTQHRRATDVDILDSILHLYIGLGDGLTEGIEIYTYHINKLNSVVLQRLEVALIITACQKTTVHLGVEGLNTAITNLREARNLADADSLNTAILQQLLGTASGDNLPAQTAKIAAEIHNTRLIANAN